MTAHEVRAPYQINQARGQFGDALLIDPVAQQHGEFVSAQPGERVSFTQAGPQSFAHQSQQSIPGCVAQGVIHSLEAIEVKKQHSDVFVGTVIQTLQRKIKLVLEEGPVRGACQLVVIQDGKHVAR